MAAARWVAVVLVLAIGCALDRDQPPPVAVVDGKPRVAVLPMRLGATISPEGRFVPRRDPSRMPSDLGATAAAQLADRLAEAGVTLADQQKVGSRPPVDLATAATMAAEAGGNLALVGAIARFDEREGNAWSVQSPASVAYDLVLVRVRDGKTVGENHFDYTQQPLTSNLLDAPRFVQAGARWMTRDEMLVGALGESAPALAALIRGERPNPVRFLGR